MPTDILKAIFRTEFSCYHDIAAFHQNVRIERETDNRTTNINR